MQNGALDLFRGRPPVVVLEGDVSLIILPASCLKTPVCGSLSRGWTGAYSAAVISPRQYLGRCDQ